MKDIVTDSIRYWEPRRLIFNAALAAVVIGTFVYHLPSSAAERTWEPVLGLLLAAVVANLLYCAAYAADIFLQLSEYQQTWRRTRWMLFVAGTVLAAVLFLLHD